MSIYKKEFLEKQQQERPRTIEPVAQLAFIRTVVMGELSAEEKIKQLTAFLSPTASGAN